MNKPTALYFARFRQSQFHRFKLILMMLLVRFLYVQVVLYHWLTTILFVVYTRKSRSIRGARQPCAVVAELLRGSVVEMRGPSARGKFADIWGNNCFIKPSVYRSNWLILTTKNHRYLIYLISYWIDATFSKLKKNGSLKSDQSSKFNNLVRTLGSQVTVSVAKMRERETVFKKFIVVNFA